MSPSRMLASLKKSKGVSPLSLPVRESGCVVHAHAHNEGQNVSS